MNSTSSFDYMQSDDTHPTFEGATASTLFTTPSGNNAVLHPTAGPYADGKNPRWNQNGHDRMGWAIDPGCPFTLVSCGNGLIETDYLPSGAPRTEGCDDGNAASGDGCSASCTVETGHSCSGAPSTCSPVCGDGQLAGDEQCDDGDADAGDGCSATCTVEPGFSCMGGPSTCQYICGDGLIVMGEGCDDGNLDEDDGCSSQCSSEEGWTCSGEPSACAPVCGDGLVLGTEECDEGADNGKAPSCCSATCSFQPLGTACDDGQICTSGDSCDGATTCVSGGPLDCSDGNVCTDESCNPASGCEYTNNTSSCDDGNACTVDDTCADAACVSGAPLECNDGNDCTDEICNPEVGCEYTNNTAPCDDASVCTLVDVCADGSCVGTTPRDCSDGNVCTDESCDAVNGCEYTSNAASCDDGNACTAPDVCSASMCMSGPPVYGFGGFLSPVDNLPVVNNGKAGRTYPIKWQLPLCSGGYVSRLSVVKYNPLRARQVSCDTSAPLDQLETETAGSSSLTYDAGSNQYHYNWKTDSSFAGRCYELMLELDDGTTQIARFKFTK